MPILRPIAGSERKFTLVKKRVESGESTRNKSGKSYTYEVDYPSIRNQYQQIRESIPEDAGYVILTGHTSEKVETLAVIKSEENLREAFSAKDGKGELNRLMETLEKGTYQHISIQLATMS
jgi:hypothetical protein